MRGNNRNDSSRGKNRSGKPQSRGNNAGRPSRDGKPRGERRDDSDARDKRKGLRVGSSSVGEDRAERNKREERPNRPFSERRNESRGPRKFEDRPRRDSSENRFSAGQREDRPARGDDDRGRESRGPAKYSGNRRTEKPFAKDGFKKKEGDFVKKNWKKPKGKNAEDLTSTRGEMRLNRHLAISGIASRREADDLIKMGLVTVNGKVVMEMGYKVSASDVVKYNGQLIRAERKVYVLLNKPKGYITAVEDAKARKTVMDLLGGNVKERIYPVGRLDRSTSGVLLFTNDGDIAKKLTHPTHGAKKVYSVALDKPLTKGDLDKIAKGVQLEDGLAKVDSISFIEGKGKNNVGIELNLVRNRVVRRIFESLGYEITKLDRTSIAGLTKKNLSRGQWRYLTDKEVNFLKML